eukprot:5069875-Amphidinium_carterae.1
MRSVQQLSIESTLNMHLGEIQIGGSEGYEFSWLFYWVALEGLIQSRAATYLRAAVKCKAYCYSVDSI